jgi:hypothetical protein
VNDRGYTFTKREGLLAHYSRASPVFEHILPDGELRLSAYRLMRDPAENKDIEPSVCSLRPSPGDEQAIRQVYALIKSERDRMHLLSLSGDAKDRGLFPGFDCCWSRPRMWEQYGEMHRGACLLFDRHRLECAVREQWPVDGTYAGKVNYTREGAADVFGREVNADEILAHEQPVQAVRDYIRPTATPTSSSRATTSPRSTSTGSWSRLATAITSPSNTGTRWWASCSVNVSRRGRRLER